MNFKIWHQLAFLLITVTTLTVVIGVGLSQLSFKSGFIDYLNKQEQRHLTNLGNNLLSAYEKNFGWEFIRDNNRLWFFYLRPKPPHFNTDKDEHWREITSDALRPNDMIRMPPPFPPPEGAFGFEKKFPKIALLDADKQLIVGELSKQDNSEYYPLKSEGVIVAYIQKEKFTGFTDHLDKMFAAKQSNAFLINTFISLILSILIALIISIYFRKRINALTQIAQQLTSGEYKQRIIIKQKDELGQLGVHFNTLAETLQKNQKSQQQWIADISHELRTPVSILKGELEAIDDNIHPLNKDAIKSLTQETERLNKLIADLYQLSISDMGALKYLKQKFIFNELIDELSECFFTRYAKQGLTLRVTNGISENFQMNGDKQRLYQLLTNLLENSLRYTNSGGEVLLHCMENKKEIILVIEDSAPGIDSNKIPHIFDRLFRLENSRSRSNGGAGLGLAIAKQIVLAHQGKIFARPSGLGGIKIACILPK